VFLYQLMNAMSDVPVTAAWTLALVLAAGRRPLASGLAMTMAIAIRPNLVALTPVLIAWEALSGGSDGVPCEPGGARTGTGLENVVWFVIGIAPALAGIAWLNARLYESALTSGYGTTADYYSLSYLATNARQFATWLAEVETPVVALAALYFVAPRLFPPAPIPFARLLVGGSLALVILSYLFYRPFDAWWYLRFLLPMWPLMMLLTAAAVDAVARRWLRPIRPMAIAAAVALLAWHGLHTAAVRSTFDLGRGERRYVDVARFVASHTDPDAVAISAQHSGSLRMYANRLTLRFDVLDPEWLDRTVDYLQSIGRRPYFVLDGAEVDAFRRRFGSTNRAGALDWPAVATFGSVVSIYDPIDRTGGTSPSPLAIGRTRAPRDGLCDPPQVWPPALRLK
jgi:hypothetical protein